MERFLGSFTDRIYAITRIVAGLMFACHGVQKLFGWFGGFGGEPGATAPLLSLMGVGGVIEIGGGLLVASGWRASWAAFVCSGQMAVAYFSFHLPRGLFPIQNGGELAVLYAWLFLLIAARGAGPWSASSLLQSARRTGEGSA